MSPFNCYPLAVLWQEDILTWKRGHCQRAGITRNLPEIGKTVRFFLFSHTHGALWNLSILESRISQISRISGNRPCWKDPFSLRQDTCRVAKSTRAHCEWRVWFCVWFGCEYLYRVRQLAWVWRHFFSQEKASAEIWGEFVWASFPGEVCGGFSGLFPWEKKRKTSTQKSTPIFKSEFRSFAAKINTARICPWSFFDVYTIFIWNEGFAGRLGSADTVCPDIIFELKKIQHVASR